MVRLVEEVKASSHGPFEFDILDMMQVPDFVEEAFDIVSRDDLIQQTRRATEADAAARSQDQHAEPPQVRLQRWFCEAAGRSEHEGPPCSIPA